MMAYENSFAYKLLQKFESLRERVQHYIAVADLCPVPVFITSRDGTAILYVNPAYKRMLDVDEEELQNFGWLKLIHAEDRERLKQDWINVVNGVKDGITTEFTYRYTRHGRIIPVKTRVTPVTNNGLVGYVVPTDCTLLLELNIDLNCEVQKAKLAEYLKIRAFPAY